MMSQNTDANATNHHLVAILRFIATKKAVAINIIAVDRNSCSGRRHHLRT
jgi:hypothetical protein